MSDEAKPVEAAQATTTVEKTSETKTVQTEIIVLTDAQKAEIANAEKVGGVKEAAVNADALAAAEGKAAPVEDNGVPSFFVEPTDRVRLDFDLLYDRKTKRIASVARTGLGIDFTELQFYGHTVEWFEFSLPNYEDMSTYRQRCSSYRRDAGKVVVDAIQLRNFLIVWHLKDWSLRDKDGKKIELKFNKEGALEEDSIKKVYQVPPTFIDVVMTNFEKEIILT
jgi:hypothetical protein